MTLIWSTHVKLPASLKLIVKTENKAVSELHSGETWDPGYSCLLPRLARRLSSYSTILKIVSRLAPSHKQRSHHRTFKTEG